jgi:hypothetical protein
MLARAVPKAFCSWAVFILLSACQGSAQGQQLDINYATTTGVGSMTTAPLKLPHGRYTFFSSADPPTCVQSVALLDHTGIAVADDAPQRAAVLQPPAGVSAPVSQLGTVPTLVQQELASGSYRLRVTTSGTGCAWQVQQILNYILSNELPPKPASPPSAPGLDVLLGNLSTDLHFHLDKAGIYHVRWSITPCARYSGDLIRDGNVEHLGDGNAEPMPPGSAIGPQTSDLPMFLGAGDWTAKVATSCFWQIGVSPWRGPTGGGAQGFAP